MNAHDKRKAVNTDFIDGTEPDWEVQMEGGLGGGCVIHVGGIQKGSLVAVTVRQGDVGGGLIEWIGDQKVVVQLRWLMQPNAGPDSETTFLLLGIDEKRVRLVSRFT